MAIIYLVRHGQNEMVGKKLAGRLPGVHLNEQGHAQARHLAAELSALTIKAVFSSPLERAQQTAEPIARIHNLPVITEPGLIEIDFGSWQAKSLKQLRRNRLWRDAQEFPDGFGFPDGETFIAAQTRIVHSLQSISQTCADKDRIICVSHCDPIRLAVAHFLGMPLNAFQRLHIDTTSVTVLNLTKDKAFLGPINALAGFFAGHE